MTDHFETEIIFKLQRADEVDVPFYQGIYSDWLAELGDPRAELLRIAVEIQSYPKYQIIETDDPPRYRMQNHFKKHFNADFTNFKMIDWRYSLRFPKTTTYSTTSNNRSTFTWYWFGLSFLDDVPQIDWDSLKS